MSAIDFVSLFGLSLSAGLAGASSCWSDDSCIYLPAAWCPASTAKL